MRVAAGVLTGMNRGEDTLRNSNVRDRRGRAWRRVWGVGAVASLALLAAGCSPPERPLVAVGTGPNGDVRVLLRPCGNAHMEEVRVSHVNDGAHRADSEFLDGWTARPPQSVIGEQEISVYRPPKAWHGEVRTASKVGTAKKLSSKGRYAVEFLIGRWSSQDRVTTVKYSGVNYFEAADIEGLAPGQWWADDQAMSRAEFQGQADDAC